MFLLIQFILLVLLFSIQSAVLDGFSVARILPDLALIYVVYCGIFFHGSRGVYNVIKCHNKFFHFCF